MCCRCACQRCQSASGVIDFIAERRPETDHFQQESQENPTGDMKKGRGHSYIIPTPRRAERDLFHTLHPPHTPITPTAAMPSTALKQFEALPEYIDVVVIGAGLSGVNQAYRIQTETKQDYVILEGRSEIGGTWSLFNYPGVRSDSDVSIPTMPDMPPERDDEEGPSCPAPHKCGATGSPPFPRCKVC